MLSKDTFRADQINRLNQIDEPTKLNNEAIIAEYFFNQKEVQAASNIAITLSHGFELSTSKIIQKLEKNGKNVYIPRTCPNYQMEFVKLTKETDLEPKVFGIMEPKNGEVINPEDLDVIVVPGLAYDTNRGYRLGFGGGYYDRYLKKTEALKMVLAFSEQIYQTNQWEVDDFDVLMDKIITEEGISFSRTK